jgi:hypothetical protein
MRRPLEVSRTKSTPVNVAFHEAGHAVAAVFCRRQLQSVVIEIPFRAEDSCTGRVVYEPVFDPSDHSEVLNARTRSLLEDEAVITLAGPFAEEAMGGAQRDLTYSELRSTYLPEADAGVVCALAELVADTFEERATFVERMRRRTVAWMANPGVPFFACVEVLANYLLGYFTVEGRRYIELDGETAEDVVLEALKFERRRGEVA